MLCIHTDKIKISTVGATFTVTFSVAPDEIGFLTDLHKMYSKMNMSGFMIKPNCSEKPNNFDKDTNVRSKEPLKMRDATAEERQGIRDYIDSISEVYVKDEPRTDCAWKKGDSDE